MKSIPYPRLPKYYEHYKETLKRYELKASRNEYGELYTYLRIDRDRHLLPFCVACRYLWVSLDDMPCNRCVNLGGSKTRLFFEPAATTNTEMGSYLDAPLELKAAYERRQALVDRKLCKTLIHDVELTCYPWDKGKNAIPICTTCYRFDAATADACNYCAAVDSDRKWSYYRPNKATEARLSKTIKTSNTNETTKHFAASQQYWGGAKPNDQ